MLNDGLKLGDRGADSGIRWESGAGLAELQLKTHGSPSLVPSLPALSAPPTKLQEISAPDWDCAGGQVGAASSSV